MPIRSVMKKILFPTDFSKTSLNAFAYALELAKKFDAEILTMHVFPTDLAMYSDYAALLSANYSINEWSDFEHYRATVPKLQALIEKHRADSIKMTHILERGDVVEKILEIEDSESIDCIVLGTNGASGFKAVFLGTVAESIINRASGLVLAIPSGCRFTHINRTLLLVKYEKPYLEILGQALEFSKKLNTHLDVLQIKDTPDETESETLKDWTRKFADERVSFYMVATSDLEQTAVSFIEKHNNNIVALAVHEKGFFEKLFFFSLSRQMAFHSTIPVMAIHTRKM